MPTEEIQSNPFKENEPANVGLRLRGVAAARPHQPAVIEVGTNPTQEAVRQVSFEELDRHSDRIAAGFRKMGIPAGSRLVLAIRPGIDFVTTVVAMLKARLVMVLIDPGMPKRHLIPCLSDSKPDGFVAIPRVHLIRLLFRRKFPQSRFHIVAGNATWLGNILGEISLDALKQDTSATIPDEQLSLDDPAAVIFTTGSTGPPKGVFYSHLQFARQIEEIRDRFDLQPGAVDLAAFPLFGLFNCMMGITTVFPAMNYTRPATADPKRIAATIKRWNVTQSFGSPAFWNTVATYCDETDESLAPLKRVFSSGAPVPNHVLRRLLKRLDEGSDIQTPYGATEALPVASIGASEVLSETAAQSEQGKGTCVGARFPGINWQVIKVSDSAITSIESVVELPRGEIGELMVQGDVVTREYVTGTDANALHKVADGNRIWHRMGDVGYLDEQDRFWFCGRKAHRVTTLDGVLYTVPCEAIFNRHPRIYRSALVGVGPLETRRPVMIVETWPDHQPKNTADWNSLKQELLDLAQQFTHTKSIINVLWRLRLPTDIRHNAKIFREQLAPWAARQLS